MSALTLWGITLGAGAIVVAVVAGFLAAIVATAGRIQAILAEIWIVGQAIANNTAHVDLLRRINLATDGLAGSVGQLADEPQRIESIGRQP